MRLPVLNESSALRYFTFFYLYAMQGVPAGFALTAISNYLQGRQVPTHQVGTFIAVVGLPWTIQFIWGPLVDRFQFSAIGHRKHWVVLSQFFATIASLGMLLITDPQRQLSLLTIMFFIHSVFASIQDASVDAMAISITPVHERGRLNGAMRGGFLIGMAIGSAVLSIVMHNIGFREAVVFQSSFLLLFSVLFFLTRLDRSDALLPFSRKQRAVPGDHPANPSLKLLFRRVYTGITQRPSLRYFAIVAAIYFSASVFIRSYTYHLINVLHWPDSSVSVLQGGWGTILTFTAILVAGNISDKVGPKKMQITVMWGICIYLLALSAGSGFWKNDLFSGTALVLWNLADPLLSVAVFPILMGLCLDKVEGSQFTAYLAIVNLCDVTGSYLTGWALNLTSAPVLGACCGLFLLIILVAMKRSGNYKVIPG